MYEELRFLFDNLRNAVAETDAVNDVNYIKERVVAIFQGLQKTINVHHTNNMNLIDELNVLKKGK